MANQPIITLWKKTSQRGSGDYFDGVMKDNQKVIGFYNSHKKNPQEPDLRIYPRLEDGKMGTEVASLWCNVSEKSGKKYLAGYVFLEGDNKEKVTGFIQESKNPKYPYLSLRTRLKHIV